MDVDESSLTVKVQSTGSLITLMQINHLYEKIQPAETIWFKEVLLHEFLCALVERNIKHSFDVILTYNLILCFDIIRYIDEDQLVINLKKRDTDLKWPDIVETWQSLTTGALQLLQGTSIYITGDSTEVNQKVARELAVGLGYAHVNVVNCMVNFSYYICFPYQ